MRLATGMPWSLTVLAFGLDLAAKATAFLVIVLVIQQVLGRRHGLLGAAVGNAGLIGLLLLPLSSLVLPSVTIACLPARTSAPISDPKHTSISLLAGARPWSFADDTMPITAAIANSSVAFHPEAKLVRGADDAPRVPPTPMTFAAAPPPGSTQTSITDWAAIAIAGYGVAALVLLARMGSSLLAVGRLRHSCVKVDDTEWTEALERWRSRLGIGRDVVLASSPRVSVPLVLGWLGPTIVLPSSLTGKPSRRHAEAVVLHELSHVRRGDYPWNVLLRFVQALYWPHVLVWLLGRALTAMRERACDDLCVHEMGGSLAYRETLLAVASGKVLRPGPALGLAMARPSKLGRRLAQIERSQGDDRCLPRWPARLVIGTMAITVASVIGAVQLVRAEARVTTRDDAPQLPKAADKALPASTAGRVFHLQVVSADTREPVPDADVRVWMSFHDVWRKTDSQGRLEITHSTGPSDRDVGVDVWGKGSAMQRHHWGMDPNKPIPEGETIKLQRGETLGGLVEDEAGRPIAGATVSLWSHNYKKKDPHELLFDLRTVTSPNGKWQTSGAPETTGELLGFQVVHPDFLSSRDYSQQEIIPKIADLRTGKAVSVMRKGVPIEGRVVDVDGKPVAGARVLSTGHIGSMHTEVDQFAVTTDANGRFRTGQVKSGEWFLIAQAKGLGPGVQSVKIGTAVPQVELALSRPHVLKGRVVDSGGKPIAGAFVNPGTWRGFRCLGAFFWTDADGRFRWDDAPNDEMSVNVNAQGYRGISMQRVAPSGEDVVFTLKPSEKVVIGYDIALVAGTTEPVGTVATVLGPDGKPLAGGRLVEIQFGGRLSIEDGVANVSQGSKSREGRTSPDGRFAIPQYDKPWFVLILGDDSYAFADKEALEKSPKIQAKPYARVEGQYLIGSRPVPNQELELSGMIGYSKGASTIFLNQKATTDSEGRFTFKNVVPASGVRIARRDRKDQVRGVWTIGEPVHVEPGKTAQFTLGGKGRPVIGRVEPPSGWTKPIDFNDRSEAHIESGRPLTPYPLSLFRGKTTRDGRDWIEWSNRWRQSPEGTDYADRRVSVGVAVAPDGSFRLDDVPPGEYRLAVRVNGESAFHVALTRRKDSGPFFRIIQTFTVPPVPGERSDEPLDVGVLRLQPRVTLEVGERAPAFEVTTVDGKKLAVPGDFQGKFLLIDFGTLWDILAPSQIAQLNEVNQKFGKDPRFAILSLTLEADNAETRKSIVDKGEPWTQAIVGPLSNPIASAYGIDDENVSTTILVGPDGKIVAKDLWRDKIDKAIGAALGRPDQ